MIARLVGVCSASAAFGCECDLERLYQNNPHFRHYVQIWNIKQPFLVPYVPADWTFCKTKWTEGGQAEWEGGWKEEPGGGPKLVQIVTPPKAIINILRLSE